MRYAVVLPVVKFVHTVDGLDGGYSALACTVSVPRPFCGTSIDRASEPKHAALVPGKPTILVVPATRPLSSPNLSTSHRHLPVDVPYGVCAHHVGFPCESLTRHCLTSSIALYFGSFGH